MSKKEFTKSVIRLGITFVIMFVLLLIVVKNPFSSIPMMGMVKTKIALNFGFWTASLITGFPFCWGIVSGFTEKIYNALSDELSRFIITIFRLLLTAALAFYGYALILAFYGFKLFIKKH